MDNLGDGKYNVYFIDYGNSAVSQKLRTIPKTTAEYPVCCHKCSVDGIKDERHFTNTMDKYFGQMLKIQILESSEDHWTVDILFNGVNIGEELRQSPKENVTNEFAQNLVDSFKMCRIATALSPNDFYVRFNENTNIHESINEILMVGESFDKLENPKIGEYCIAKSQRDGAYYRAQVTAVTNDGFEVNLIDFGEQCVTDDLRVILENPTLKNLSTRAKHCALENLTEVDFWSEEATHFFKAIINDHFNETFQVEILQTHNDPWIVRLSVNSNDVAKELIAKMQGALHSDCIVDDLVRGITELDTENSLILHSKDTVNEIIDNIYSSSGRGSLDEFP